MIDRPDEPVETKEPGALQKRLAELQRQSKPKGPVTCLYRKDGGEVIKISRVGQDFGMYDGDFYGFMLAPWCPDGHDCVEVFASPHDPNRPSGPRRVEGFANQAHPEKNMVKNATAEEIAYWPVAERNERLGRDQKLAVNRILLDPVEGKLWRGLIRCIAERMGEEPGKIEAEILTFVAEDLSNVADV